jgi:hypothetical protein
LCICEIGLLMLSVGLDVRYDTKTLISGR